MVRRKHRSYDILIDMDIQTVTNLSLPLLKKYHVKKAALFGSVVRGDETKDSDIDILIELPKHASLYDFINLQIDLEERLGKKVDLVEFETIKPRLKPYSLRDNIHIYPAT